MREPISTLSQALLVRDMTAEEYHADPCAVPSLSSSIAHLLVAKSPLHAHHAHPRLGGKTRAASKTLDNGTLVHELLLGKGKGFAVIKAPDGEEEYTEFRCKAAREARDAARAEGKVPILQHQLDEALEVVDVMQARLRGLGISLSGESEVCLFWTEVADDGTAVQCRAMLDHLHVVPRKFARIYDVKTCRSSHPKACSAHMISYGYDIQAAAYLSGVSQLHPDLAGRTTFMDLFCESDAPHAVTPAEPDGSMRELGYRRWRRAVNLWAACTKSGKWPGYVTAPVKVEAPHWALSGTEYSSDDESEPEAANF